MSATRRLHLEELEERKGARLLGLSIDRAAVSAVLIAAISTRVVIFMVVWLSMITIPMRWGELPYLSASNLLLDGLVRHDSWWYLMIATQGYTIGDAAAGIQGNVAFFPLYPLLVRAAGGLVGDPALGGVLVANLAFLALLSYLYALTRHEFDEDTAARAVFYLAAAPTAVFFSALYTESVFLALTAATFYYARVGRWGGAALAAALASATRNTGVLLGAVIAIEGLHQAGFFARPAGWRSSQLLAHARSLVPKLWLALPAMVAAAFAAAGLASYMLFLGRNFGDPLAFIHVQAAWGRAAGPSGLGNVVNKTISELGVGNLALGQINAKVFLDVLFTLVFLPLAAAVALRMRPAYGVYTVMTFMVPLSTGTTGSMTRYILMLLPAFMLLARWGRRPTVDRLVLVASLPLMAYMAVLFAHWYFAG
jgi:hypothetical protein